MYQEWLSHLFEHDETLGDWKFETEPFDSAPEDLLAFITRAFSHYDRDISKYSDWQIGHGLYYIFSGNCSNYAYVMRDEMLPIESRLKAINAMKNIYTACFEKRCLPQLCHLNEAENPLNATCFILWDTTPLTYCEHLAEKDVFYAAIAEVMTHALSLSNVACVESGLHGLGHLTDFYPEAREIIKRFIKRSSTLDKRLLAYAENAVSGNIQ